MSIESMMCRCDEGAKIVIGVCRGEEKEKGFIGVY